MRFKKNSGYHVVPPPLTGNYMPPLADLSFAGLDDSVYRPTANKASASISNGEESVTPPSNTGVEMPRVESVRPSRVIIKYWGNPQQALKYKALCEVLEVVHKKLMRNTGFEEKCYADKLKKENVPTQQYICSPYGHLSLNLQELRWQGYDDIVDDDAL
ncbi:hypothetical protein Tco_0466656 [Tanacetum coccineum]